MYVQIVKRIAYPYIKHILSSMVVGAIILITYMFNKLGLPWPYVELIYFMKWLFVWSRINSRVLFIRHDHMTVSLLIVRLFM